MSRLTPSQRIIAVIEYCKLSYNALSKKMGRSNAQFLHDIVKGVTKNVTENVAEEINVLFPEINKYWLITGEGDMLQNIRQVDVIQEPKASYSNMPTVITVDNMGNENIVLVPIEARAGYVQGFYNPEYIQSLPTFWLPGLGQGTFRAFPVKGHSMSGTLENKSFIVGQWVENWADDIKDGEIYIIVYDDGDKLEDGVTIKRCINKIRKYGNVICKSDNLDRTSYPNFSIDATTIKEVWHLKIGLKTSFPDPSALFDRMNNLEADVEILKNKMKN